MNRPNQPYHQQGYMQPPGMMMQPPHRYYPQQSQNENGEIFGEKKNKIMVRQLWLGGIPEQTNHISMGNVMSEFGQI